MRKQKKKRNQFPVRQLMYLLLLGLFFGCTYAGNDLPALQGWQEYSEPVDGYRFAVPESWTIIPAAGGGLVTTTSAASFSETKGRTPEAGGEWPEGMVKIDFNVWHDVEPAQTLPEFARQLMEDTPEEELIVEETLPEESCSAVSVSRHSGTTGNREQTALFLRLAERKVLVICVLPREAWNSEEVRGTLKTLTPGKSGRLQLPAPVPESDRIPSDGSRPDAADNRVIHPCGSFDNVPESPIELYMPFSEGTSWMVGGWGYFYGDGTHSNANNDYYATDWNKSDGASAGQAVYPVAAGTVLGTGFDGDGYGNYIVVRHRANSRVTTRYAHLSSIAVRKDDVVDIQTRIGNVGSTGNSTGPHLHLSFYLDDLSRQGLSPKPSPMWVMEQTTPWELCDGQIRTAWKSGSDTGPGPSCGYASIQCRIQRNTSDPWDTYKEISLGGRIRVGTMYNGTGEFADNSCVNQIITCPDGAAVYVAVGAYFTPPGTGTYQVRATSANLSGSASFRVGGGTASCNYINIQCRVQRNTSDPWDTYKEISLGSRIRVGTMYNGTGQFADNSCVVQLITCPDGSGVNLGIGDFYTPREPGTYRVRSTSGQLANSASFLVTGTPTCSYINIQCRVQRNTSDPWDTYKEISLDSRIRVGTMYNGTGQFADNSCVQQSITCPDGTTVTPGIGEYYKPTAPGTYRVRSTSGSLTSTASFLVSGNAVCNYTSIQCRVQKNITDPWDTYKEIAAGDLIRVGTMYDGTGQFAADDCVQQVITRPDGTTDSLRIGAFFEATAPGTYQVRSTSGSLGGTASFLVTSAVLRGDANGDNSIGISDALLIARYVAGLTVESFNEANADVNEDGTVSIADALIIARYVANLIEL